MHTLLNARLCGSLKIEETIRLYSKTSYISKDMQKKMASARWNDPSTALKTTFLKQQHSQYPSTMTALNAQYHISEGKGAVLIHTFPGKVTEYQGRERNFQVHHTHMCTHARACVRTSRTKYKANEIFRLLSIATCNIQHKKIYNRCVQSSEGEKNEKKYFYI